MYATVHSILACTWSSRGRSRGSSVHVPTETSDRWSPVAPLSAQGSRV